MESGSLGIHHAQDYVGLTLYLFTCSIIIGLGEGMRTARRRAECNRQYALAPQKQLEHEVTERKQAEAELRRAEQPARSVVEHVLDGILTIDERAEVQSFHPAAERLFGYSAPEVLGQHVKMLMPEPYHLGHGAGPVAIPQVPGGNGAKARSGRQCRILVVDDLRDAADSLAQVLRWRGHETRTAYDGLEAVQAATAFQPNVVLLAIGLPKRNGYEAARRIRDEPWGGSVALVALTGWGRRRTSGGRWTQ